MTGCKADRAKKETFLACEAGSYKPYPGEDLSDICPPCTKKLNTDHSGHQQCLEMSSEYPELLTEFPGRTVALLSDLTLKMTHSSKRLQPWRILTL